MRVLHLTTSYPTPESSVSGVFVREHAQAAALHDDVALVHLHRTHDHRGLPRVERLVDEPFPAWRVHYPYRPNALSMPLHLLAAARGLRAASFAPDVVHAHFFLAGAPAALLAPRTPMVLTEQWSIFTRPDPGALSPALRQIARFAYGRAAIVLPVSRALQEGIERHGLHPRFRIVPNVVDTSLFHPGGARDDRVLAVGMMTEAKGHDLLVDAVAELPGVEIDVIGDGPLRADVERRIAERGVADRVHLHGVLPKDEVAHRMAAAELFLLTSRYDNNPCVVIEALASGLPVVATAVGGIPELVDETNGRLAAPNDASAIASELAAARAGIASYDRAAIAERAKARYGRERIGAELAEIYREVA